jgi:hypothetical protein
VTIVGFLTRGSSVRPGGIFLELSSTDMDLIGCVAFSLPALFASRRELKEERRLEVGEEDVEIDMVAAASGFKLPSPFDKAIRFESAFFDGDETSVPLSPDEEGRLVGTGSRGRFSVLG